MASLPGANFDLRTIYNELAVVKYKWFKVGIQLGIPHYKLKEFEKEEEPLAAAINYCLKGNLEGVPFTWESIVTALKSIDGSLAKRLIKVYCSNEEPDTANDNGSANESSTVTSTTSSGSSSFKLPSVDMKTYYPYLDGNGDYKMSDAQLSSLRVQLDEQTKKIKRTFASLVFDLQKHIEDSNKIDDLRNVLRFYDDKNIQDLLASCSNVTEVFDRISPYFSFFDFGIIKLITKKLGSKFNEQKLTKYMKMFKDFSKQRVCECPKDAFGEVNKSEKCFFVKLDKNIRSLTVEELEKFKYNLCKVMHIELRLLRVEDGCVKLSFRVLGEVNVITKKQQEALKKLDVLKIKYGKEEVDLSASSLEEKVFGGASSKKSDSGFYSEEKDTKSASVLANISEDDIDPTEVLQKSAQPTNITSTADLHDIILSGDVQRLKLELENKGYNPFDRDDYNFSALHIAAQHGKLEILKYLIEDFGCNHSLRGSQGATPLHIAAKFGQLEVVKYLIEQNVDPDVKDDDGYLPVHHACSSNHLETMKYLIDGTQYTDLFTDLTADGLALIHIATEGGHMDIMQYLIEDRKCDASFCTKKGRAPIFYACIKGHAKIVKYLVEEYKCDPSILDHSKTSLLHLAAKYGHLEIVKYLVQKGCNVNTRNTLLTTPLLEAAATGQLGVLQYLIKDKNCNPKITNHKGFNCLHAASDGGHVEIVKYLIEKQQMNPRQKIGKSKTTCLHLAASKGRQLVVEYLSILCGHDNPYHQDHFNNGTQPGMDSVFSADDNGLTPVHLAALNNHKMVLECFIEKHHIPPEIPTSTGNYTPLELAKRNPKSNAEVIAYLEERSKDRNFTAVDVFITVVCTCPLKMVKAAALTLEDCDIANAFGQTPLLRAAGRGRLDVVKYLIEERNCNPSKRDKAGNTALHMAAESGNLELVKYLISKHQCDPNAATYYGHNFNKNFFSLRHQKTTPLYAAAEYGHLEIVRYLLESDFSIDPEVESYGGLTSLLIAANEGELHVVEYLIKEHNCNPLHKDKDENTAIHHATKFGRMPVLKYLIEDLNCPLNMENAYGQQAIHIAAIQGYLEPLKCLIVDFKVDPNTGNRAKLNVLHLAAAHGHLEMVKYLVDNSLCSTSSQDHKNMTPLHWAASHGHLNVVQYLTKEAKCDHLCRDLFGHVPLHFAAYNGRFEVTKYLIKEMQTPIVIKDGGNNTPLDYAVVKKQAKVVLLLFVIYYYHYCVSDSGY